MSLLYLRCILSCLKQYIASTARKFQKKKKKNGAPLLFVAFLFWGGGQETRAERPKCWRCLCGNTAVVGALLRPERSAWSMAKCTTQLAQMRIDPKFVKLTADVVGIILEDG